MWAVAGMGKRHGGILVQDVAHMGHDVQSGWSREGYQTLIIITL